MSVAVDKPGTQHDIVECLKQIGRIVQSYENALQKFEAIKKPTQTNAEDFELRRMELKTTFITKKNLVRSLSMLLPECEHSAHTTALQDLQSRYRECVDDSKVILDKYDRSQLIKSGAGTGIELPDKHTKTNTDILEDANQINVKTTQQLVIALQTVHTAIGVGVETAATLDENRSKIEAINKGLDEVESELTMSKRLIVNVVKRLYTDKVIIAFTFLVVMGIVGIIVYATLHPGAFNVPSVIIPPTFNITRL